MQRVTQTHSGPKCGVASGAGEALPVTRRSLAKASEHTVTLAREAEAQVQDLPGPECA